MNTAALAREVSEHANCGGADVEMFMEYETASLARKVCNNCRVQFECFSLAMSTGDQGMWGGVFIGENVRKNYSRVGPSSRLMIEKHAHTLMRRMRLTTEQYVERFGSPASPAAYKRALRSLRASIAA